jgi:uroporphyrinogen-III synthase
VSEQNVTLLPLQGKRILVTRAREQAGVLSTRLQALGAVPVELPTIRIVPPQNWEPLDTALSKLFLVSTPESQDTVWARGTLAYSWVIFTSANGVNICCDRLLSLGYHPRTLSGVRVAAIGPATAAALANYGVTADLVPDEYIAESVAAALKNDALQRGDSLEGKRILLPRAAEARKILVTELQQAGALVDEVAAYSTIPVASDDEQGHAIWHLLQNGQIDIITFTSSSTVRNFMQWLGRYVQEPGPRKGGHDISLTNSGDAAKNVVTPLVGVRPGMVLPWVGARPVKIACIGPITSRTARELGLEVHIEAQEFTIDGLVEAIIQSEE